MKTYDEMTWKEQKLQYLKYRFEKKYLYWKDRDLHDDRRLYCNCYEILTAAINSLPDEPHLTVCVAMNEHMNNQYFESMKSILEHFKDR